MTPENDSKGPSVIFTCSPTVKVCGNAPAVRPELAGALKYALHFLMVMAEVSHWRRSHKTRDAGYVRMTAQSPSIRFREVHLTRI